MARPRTPSLALPAAAFFAVAALVTGVLGFAAHGAGPAAAGLTGPSERQVQLGVGVPLADPHPLWLPRHARLTAADVTHTRVMARAARQVARATARRQARQAAALAAQQAQQQSAQQAAAQPAAPAAASGGSGHIFSFAELEALWTGAGGPASEAANAACVATAESSGKPWDTGSLGEIGLWQLMPFHADASYDPATNAQGAVLLWEGQGWSPWTTRASCGL